jgi:nicotinamidase-related amidase
MKISNRDALIAVDVQNDFCTGGALRAQADDPHKRPYDTTRTSTFALNDATRPFVLVLADKGISRAL